MKNENDNTKNESRTMLFTMGLPGSGKSTVIRREGLDTDATIIDPDAVKAAHPDYDPKNPTALHVWSKQVTDGMFNRALLNGGKWIVDGTGTNAEAMVAKIRRAQAAGFHTVLVYVQVSLATSLKRNATRTRVVPEHVVREKAEVIATSYEIVSRYVDEIKTIVND